jgi:alanine dehydrogenase
MLVVSMRRARTLLKVGVPIEILDNEYRVALTLAGAAALTSAGSKVFIERGAGVASGIPDEAYKKAGATIVSDAASVFSEAELILKVKEPQPEEVSRLRKGQILFSYLHLAASPALTHSLCKSGATCIGCETVQLDNGHLPLLVPMSEIAGRLSVQIGASLLELPMGVRGLLLGGVPGVEPGEVVIVGGGVVGTNAAKIAVGLGARVTVFDASVERMRYLDDVFGGQVRTIYSVGHNLAEILPSADLLIGAVLLPGRHAPRIVTKEMVKTMKRGSVIVDVAVDQGGCVETIRPTTHSSPTYEIDGVVHYGVVNIPGTVPWTATRALANATLSYCVKLARSGYQACLEDPALARGVNIHEGKIVHPGVAEACDPKLVTA